MKKNLYEVYKTEKSYDWNYDYGPTFEGEIPPRKETFKPEKIFNFEIRSRLGIPAGPLLNAKWVDLYARMGFDIPVYKTVRTVERPSHPAPNCAYVKALNPLTLKDTGTDIFTRQDRPESLEQLTITNSFGVPSKPPSLWMKDVEKAYQSLQKGQVMIVSINGTPGLSWSLEEDYARCASMAVEAGAQIIEANYSCPNVCSGEGSIYSDPEFSARISQKIRQAIGKTPFLIKMGALEKKLLKEVIIKNRPWVDGFSAINTIAMQVRHPDGTQALPGQGRLRSGLCGGAITQVARQCTEDMIDIRKQQGDDFVICSVGGIMTPKEARERLDRGADLVMTATAAMWDPYFASRFHSE